jgi:hypothetical protein
MPKKSKPSKAKTQKKETRDFSQIALSVVEKATGGKLKRR